MKAEKSTPIKADNVASIVIAALTIATAIVYIAFYA